MKSTHLKSLIAPRLYMPCQVQSSRVSDGMWRRSIQSCRPFTCTGKEKVQKASSPVNHLARTHQFTQVDSYRPNEHKTHTLLISEGVTWQWPEAGGWGRGRGSGRRRVSRHCSATPRLSESVRHRSNQTGLFTLLSTSFVWEKKSHLRCWVSWWRGALVNTSRWGGEGRREGERDRVREGRRTRGR